MQYRSRNSNKTRGGGFDSPFFLLHRLRDNCVGLFYKKKKKNRKRLSRRPIERTTFWWSLPMCIQCSSNNVHDYVGTGFQTMISCKNNIYKLKVTYSVFSLQLRRSINVYTIQYKNTTNT